MVAEFSGAPFNLLVEHVGYIDPVMFAVMKYGVRWLCSGVWG